jgi:cytoskeletal protein CcmA (bactofilin family)
MFKKTEESEWTRFSRALGGAQPAPPREAEEATEAEPDEPPTIAQAAPAEPEAHSAPAPAPVEPGSSTTTSGQPAPGVTGAPGRLPDLEPGETVVGDGASVEGTVRSDRSIRVRGAVQGEIESKQRVVVEESARVQARISAEYVTVLGEVNGAIDSQGRVEIASTGRVTGEVTAGTLVIQEGAFFEGQLKMSSNRDSTGEPERRE